MPETIPLKDWLREYGPAEGTVPGLPCYGLADRTGPDCKCYDGRITKVGREYVTTDIFRDARFRVRDMGSAYLEEADGTGLVHKLFLSREDRDEYIGRETAAVRFAANRGRYRDSCTARQLKAAMAVMERASDPTCKKILALIDREEGPART